jgi:hypothetical protein
MEIKSFTLRSLEALQGKIEVNRGNVDGWRTYIGTCRESVVLGPLVLPFIPKLAEASGKQELWTHAVGFWNEQALIADQWYKAAETKFVKAPGNVAFRNKCIDLITIANTHAQDIINSHADSEGMKDIAARQGLFEAKALFMSGKFADAIPVIDRSIEQLSQSSQPENAIELRGYKAEALVRSGRVQEGVRLGLSTFDAYDTDPHAQQLRDWIDYNRWVSWRAGCILKLADALIETKSLQSLSPNEQIQLGNDMQKAYTLGTQKDVKFFTIREKQLKSTWKKLKKSGVVLRSLFI